MISLSNISIVFHLDYISIFWKTFPNLPNLSVHSVNLQLLPFVCRAPGPGVTTAKDSKSVLSALGFRVRKGGQTVPGGCKGWGAQMKRSRAARLHDRQTQPVQAPSFSLELWKKRLPPLECRRPGAERSRLCVKCCDRRTCLWASGLPAFLLTWKTHACSSPPPPSPLSQMFFTRVEANFKSLLKIHVIMIEIVIFKLINMYSEFCWTAISVANYYCSFFVYTENRNHFLIVYVVFCFFVLFFN